ncbi:MAG: TRAP transporter small permease [Deltaproteobacteria bacterium]|nr:MAG: TRAP transporter small permease [Deltaproteobacteria bacterium]
MSAWSAFERKMCRFLMLISGLTLAFMFLFTLTDVLMRAFGKPIVGDFEVISFLGAVVIGFAIPYTALLKGHIIVDFAIEKLPKKVGDGIQIATRIIVIAFFLWVGWNFVGMSLDLIRTKEVTPVFRLPYYPISFGLAFCCVVQCFPLLSQIGKIIGGRHG